MLGMFIHLEEPGGAFGKPSILPSLPTLSKRGSHCDLYEADPTSCLLSTQVSWICLVGDFCTQPPGSANMNLPIFQEGSDLFV